MKRVLLDHCVPRRVRQAAPGCEVATAYQRGWAELKNGALLEAAERDGFDVLVTADKISGINNASPTGASPSSNCRLIPCPSCFLTSPPSATP